MVGVRIGRRSLMQGPAWSEQGPPHISNVHHEETAQQSQGSSSPAEEEEADFTNCLGPISVASRMLGLETFTATTEVQEYGSRTLILKKSSKAIVYTFTVVTMLLMFAALFIVLWVNYCPSLESNSQRHM
ncbi:hypothetical protein PR048_026908 [Dryococelus australis]|uniref:Uncharacterized protein n=1 Tax=Dryococelus australis TaxID=614101 RepID=A0ABQ9GMM0_9NEOP|nr:hypothetical protein PR048_026908 [Dryococelus australis]